MSGGHGSDSGWWKKQASKVPLTQRLCLLNLEGRVCPVGSWQPVKDLRQDGMIRIVSGEDHSACSVAAG